MPPFVVARRRRYRHRTARVRHHWTPSRHHRRHRTPSHRHHQTTSARRPPVVDVVDAPPVMDTAPPVRSTQITQHLKASPATEVIVAAPSLFQLRISVESCFSAASMTPPISPRHRRSSSGPDRSPRSQSRRRRSFQLRMLVSPVSETDSQRRRYSRHHRVDCKIITWCQRYRSSTASRHLTSWLLAALTVAPLFSPQAVAARAPLAHRDRPGGARQASTTMPPFVVAPAPLDIVTAPLVSRHHWTPSRHPGATGRSHRHHRQRQRRPRRRRRRRHRR